MTISFRASRSSSIRQAVLPSCSASYCTAQTRRRDAGKHGAVVQAGHSQIVGHEDMPRPQLPHDLKGDLIIAAKDAICLLLQRSLQCIERLPGRFHTGMNEPLAHWHTKFREST